MRKKDILTIFLIFVFAFLVRYYFITSHLNIPFDYDQYEDLLLTRKILVDKDPPVIGRAIYGNPNIHHGVVFYYFNIPPFALFNGNPIAVALWISLFNAGLSILVYFFSLSLFKKRSTALISSILTASSYELVQFSSWISTTTLPVITVPIFFFGLWAFIKGKKKGLIVSAFFLGLSIQADLMFLYLIPVALICLVFYKPKLSIKTLVISAIFFLLSISTLIITELKLHFVGLKSFIFFGRTFDESRISLLKRIDYFLHDFVKTFSLNLLPTKPNYAVYITLAILSIYFFNLFLNRKTKKPEKKGLLFLFIFLFSPALMLLLGYHSKPWFLIGIFIPVILTSSYSISTLKRPLLILPIVLIFIFSNLLFIKSESQKGLSFFNLEDSSLLSPQLKVVDYLYQEAKGEPFGVNAITYPLHHEALWAYHLTWHGKEKYGHLPTWLGPEQFYPYDILPHSTGNEKIFFLIMDKSVRIPEIHRENARIWANQHGNLLEEKDFDGFVVQKRSTLPGIFSFN